MENNETPTSGATQNLEGSSGHTWLSGTPSDQTTTPSSQGGTVTMLLPSGGTTLQMLKGPIGTEHLQQVTSYYHSIIHTYNSIPKDSSTLLPSVDSYIATLALIALSETDHASRNG